MRRWRSLRAARRKACCVSGLPTDFSVAFLQEAISDFAAEHADVTMAIHCDLSRQVLDWLHADELDIALALLNRDKNPYLVRSWEERPIWAAAKDTDIHKRSRCRWSPIRKVANTAGA